jgi:hypothetical protein
MAEPQSAAQPTAQTWKQVERDRHYPSFEANQGLATWVRSGKPTIILRGSASIPPEFLAAGTWVHIGDPDAHGDVLVDCYQGESSAKGKMFRATRPDGTTKDYVHPLTPGELYNNSFVAITPDGQWMVAGEWGEMSRFLVFPTPELNPAANAATLGLRGTIHLDHPLRNVQGASFVDATTLLCATDDPDKDLWPVSRQLLSVELAHPLDGQDVEGRVTCLQALPMNSACSGTFETEGMDYDSATGDLRVIIVPPSPCDWVAVDVYRFRRATAG